MTIRKNENSRSREFWQSTGYASLKVKKWPEWKRNLRLTEYSVGSNCNIPKKSDTQSPCNCQLIDNLKHACRQKSVSFSISYCESDNSWYVGINSIAPSECFMSKNYGLLESAVDMAMRHLATL